MTTETIVPLLKDNNVRLFAIVPPQLEEYKLIAEATRGAVFDIKQPFSRILDQYSTQLTNLYAVTYRSDSKMVRDSINVAILDERRESSLSRSSQSWRSAESSSSRTCSFQQAVQPSQRGWKSSRYSWSS
ncbi:MAG: hypothetical protein IPP80_03595 [Ignavibacteria bacterium]|nr:hypothetical protein [Ignavibacteria bacterium]